MLKPVEFHYILPLANIQSVLAKGLLCHENVAKIAHSDVSLATVQELRANKSVPGGLRLHKYVNLYFDARNPMMFKRKDQADSLCVIRLGVQVLDIEGVVITDQNAASKYVRFRDPSQIGALDLEMIYAKDWRHPEDQIAQWRHSSAKCAEVLVPEELSCDYFLGAYVIDASIEQTLAELGFVYPISVNRDIFFG